jgi:hypothetical protein
MVVFKNPRDVSQIIALAHQMYPKRTKYFLTGKWMDPWHEMIGIVFIGNVKCVRIIDFQNILGFFFITLSIAVAGAYVPLSAGRSFYECLSNRADG